VAGHRLQLESAAHRLRIYAVMRDLHLGPMTMTRIVAVDIDSSNLQMLSKRESAHSRGLQLGGSESSTGCPATTGRC
jgi:hypothetical protein